ncbi:MAG TPA: FAD-dependent oxidoreductase [Acidimicrobiia bacterium]
MSERPPAIIAVDDEPEVLRAVMRDLRSRYAGDFQILGASGGQEAIEVIEQISLRGSALALILADQRMPKVSGIDVLRQSLSYFPDSKKTLLTAYADTEAAISAINDVGLDHYIMKPWDPPESKLYPILDDLLDDWKAGYRPTFSGLRVISQEWSKPAFELKAFLAMNQIPYRSMTLESDEEAVKLMESTGAGLTDLPLVLTEDGDALFSPSTVELADRVGLQSHASQPAYDVAIIGAGPAGLAAAVYGSSEGLKTLLIEGTAPGGQAGQSTLIENYLGFPKGISGADLARRAHTQATRLGAEILVPARVVGIERNDPYKVIRLADGTSITAKAVVVASGVEYRRLEGEGLKELTGAGVYYGTSNIEASYHRGQTMLVVGGGNSAGQAALFLTRFTEDVRIVIRSESLDATMSRYLIDNIEANASVSVMARAGIVAARGDTHLRSVVVKDLDTEDEDELDVGAVFIFIGQRANTDWLAGLVDLDENGFVLAGASLGSLSGWNVDRDPLPLETSVPGIFVAGDVRHDSIRRVAGATGEGSAAIRLVHQHLASL